MAVMTITPEADAAPLAAGDPRLGAPLDALDTPALLLDHDACRRNLRRMAGFFAARPAVLRPHFKNHKCVRLARLQIASGAVGMTCAKLGEAEVLVDHGIDDVLIANQVVGAAKVARLVSLARRARVAVAIDHVDQALAISAAARAAGATVGLLIEVDIGMGRCGVQPGPDALTLARQVLPLPGVRLEGIQAFEGHLVNVVDRPERGRRAVEAMSRAVETRRLLEGAGVPIARLTGCSSATYDTTGVLDGVDEIQAGTYATMDCQYRKLVPEFEVALTVLARVISRPAAGRAVLDVGVKGAGGEFGPPAVPEATDATIPFFLSEEHVVIQNAPDWPIGRAVQIVPSHACTTCNLHREFVVHAAGRVIDVWPIDAAGRLQ
jgi:D-serine deaminase-like pyridoxal phosphate-dependent protein